MDESKDEIFEFGKESIDVLPRISIKMGFSNRGALAQNNPPSPRPVEGEILKQLM